VVACPKTDPERDKAIEIMFQRIRHVMEILGYGDLRRGVVLGLIRMTALIHGMTGKMYSAYSWIIGDKYVTKDNDYFTIS
jgi:hypothetical protein